MTYILNRLRVHQISFDRACHRRAGLTHPGTVGNCRETFLPAHAGL
jgi:hypothetical protein